MKDLGIISNGTLFHKLDESGEETVATFEDTLLSVGEIGGERNDIELRPIGTRGVRHRPGGMIDAGELPLELVATIEDYATLNTDFVEGTTSWYAVTFPEESFDKKFRGYIKSLKIATATDDVIRLNVTVQIDGELLPFELPDTGGEDGNVPVSGIELKSPIGVFLEVGETQLVEFEVLPENATDKSVTFEYNPSVIKVEQVSEGSVEVEGLTEGNTNLKILTHNGKYNAIVVINVTEGEDDGHVPVESINVLGGNEVTFVQGETRNLIVEVMPYNATNQEVRLEYNEAELEAYMASEEYQEFLVVTGDQVGQYNLRIVSLDNEDVYVDITVNIIEEDEDGGYVPVESIRVGGNNELTLVQGAGRSFYVDVMPYHATNKEVRVENNEAELVAYMENEEYLNIFGDTEGQYTIRIISLDNEDVYVDVTVNIIEPVAMTDIIVTPDVIDNAVIGQTYVIEYEPVPSNTTEYVYIAFDAASIERDWDLEVGSSVSLIPHKKGQYEIEFFAGESEARATATLNVTEGEERVLETLEFHDGDEKYVKLGAAEWVHFDINPSYSKVDLEVEVNEEEIVVNELVMYDNYGAISIQALVSGQHTLTLKDNISGLSATININVN